MGNGLHAWWHRRIASSALAGVVMCAVPVAVAALIAFGTGLSGISAGLAAVTGGPSGDSDIISASAQTDPSKLNRAVLGLASNSLVGSSSAPRSTTGGGSARNETVVGTGGSGSGSTPSRVSGPAGSGGGSSDPSTVTLPGPGGASDIVNNTVDSAGSTVDSAGSTVDNTLNTVNNTLGGAGSTVNGLLNP